MKPLIEVSHISKRYQHIQALEDVSFAVNQGELFGIIGPDGSGKSTLSEYLRDSTNPLYSNCSIEPPLDDNAEEILVYNENYVNEVFYSSDTQRGIFSFTSTMIFLEVSHIAVKWEAFGPKLKYPCLSIGATISITTSSG